MTKAILCNGCETWELISPFTNSLTILSNEDNEFTHLCETCSKMFWKWMDKIPVAEDEK